MKRLFLLSFLVISLSMFSQTKNDSVLCGYWYYDDGYTTKQLILKNNFKFHWYYSSCEGTACYSGKFSQQGDSLLLNIKNSEMQLKFLIRDNKIFTYSGKNNDYPNFEPLSFVGKQKRFKCDNKEIEIVEFEE